MRIAFAYDLPYPWHMGGIEQINAIEAEELAKYNEVHFFTMRWPGMHRIEVRNGVTYHAWYPASINTVYRHGRRSIRKAVAFSISLLRLFGHNFDMLIVDQFPYLHIPIVMAYSRLTGCRVVINVSEVWSKEYWKKYLGPLGSLAYSTSIYLSKKGSIYIVPSSKTRKELTAIGVKSSKIRIFAPSISREEIEAVSRTAKNKVKRVIFASRLIKEKRIDLWIEAVGRAINLDPAIRGVIIGAGQEEQSLKALIKRLGLSNKIKIVPFFKNKRKLYEYLAESSVMLNMSAREGLSIITIEALALNTSVIIPGDSPIPPEIKRFCNVIPMQRIPEEIVRICSTKQLPKKIGNSMKRYYSSEVNNFFLSIEKDMGF